MIIHFGTNNLGNERFSRKSQIKPSSSSKPNHVSQSQICSEKANFLKFGSEKADLATLLQNNEKRT